MPKPRKFAIYTKRIHYHRAPAGFVTSFEVVIDSIDFKETRIGAENFIEEQPNDNDEYFWTIEEVYLPEVKS